MKLSNKHTPRILQFVDYSGGLNTSTSGELIKENEFQECRNFEYGVDGNKLQRRGGLTSPLISFPQPILGMYYDFEVNTFLVFLINKEIWKTDLFTKSQIGYLSGNLKPICCKFGGKILIASGDKLQSYDYTTITTIASSYLCDIVFSRFGRVVISKTNTDNMYYSGIGDETNWLDETDDESSSKRLEIGYKDGGDIVGISQMANDIFVFKSNGKVFQLSNEYPDWTVYEVGKNTDCDYRFAIENIGNEVVFVGKHGFSSLAGVQAYGNIRVNTLGEKINNRLSKTVIHPTMWLLQRKRQLIISPCESNELFAYHYVTGAFTQLTFPIPIVDMAETKDDVIVAMSNSLHYWRNNVLRDFEAYSIECELKTKKQITIDKLLIKKINISVESPNLGICTLSVNQLKKPFAWTPTRKFRLFRTNYKVKELELSLSSTDLFSLNHILLEVADV